MLAARLGAVVVALFSCCVGCARALPNTSLGPTPERPAGPPPEIVPGDFELICVRTGGLAGVHDKLTISSGGGCELEQRARPKLHFTIERDELILLINLINEADFFNLKSKYLPDKPVPDSFQYTISCRAGGRAHTVSTTDFSAPLTLMPLLNELNRLLSIHGREGG